MNSREDKAKIKKDDEPQRGVVIKGKLRLKGSNYYEKKENKASQRINSK